ncbi:MAG: hypothetical protein N5P05_001089 [Chroococcopsis gigantea SAG 12.99]|jgi:hypothetical protein|nr:PD-(D/E)XK nuclease family protein [Chlorogloea purpurea SAG 13.99]MDV2999483.1 hypothetical protein [Chroococcopsis gigantea SAG 12.99]
MNVFSPPFFRLSQGHLNLLQSCPPQFQRIHLQQLSSPPELGQLEAQRWGSQFHRLMQQRELGLSIEDFIGEDREIYIAIQALLAVAPEISNGNANQQREAEHCRTLYYQDYLFTVIYDLIIFENDRAMIFDWKTYLKPAKLEKLKRNWQTKLYLYVLAETSDYVPEDISLTYWFVQLPQTPQKVTFNYDSQQHRQNRKELSELLERLKKWLADYEESGVDFPHIPDCVSTCSYFQYLQQDRDKGESESDGVLTSLETIEEINPFI